MADTIGTATIKVLPDLTEFAALLQSIDLGITLIDTTRYEYTDDGQPLSVTRTVYVDRAPEPKA